MRHLIRQTAILTISNIITRGLSMLFFLLLARSLAVSDYGNLRYLISLAFLFSIFFSGFPVSLTRLISQDKNNKKRINTYFSVGLTLAIIALALEIIIILLFINQKLLLIILLFGYFIDSFYFGLIRGFLDYIKLYLYRLVSNLIEVVCVLLFMFLFEMNVVIAAIIFSLSWLISIGIFESYYVVLPVKYSIKSIKRRAVKEILKYAIPITIGSLSYDILFNLSTILIQNYVDTINVAYYSVALTITQIFTFIPIASSTLILPKIAGLKQKIDLRPYLKVAMLGIFISAAILFIFLLFFGEWIVVFFFKEQYLPSLNVLYILSLAQIFMSTFSLFSNAWYGIKKPFISMYILLFAAIINIVLSLIFIPKIGIVGAAYSTLISTFIAFMLVSIPFFVYVKKRNTEYENPEK
ncbi:MAG: flippase [Candidatus Woesearchaeota archaeon]